MSSQYHCVGTFWTEREIEVIDALAKKLEMSHVAVIRNALRNYQLFVEGPPNLPDKAGESAGLADRGEPRPKEVHRMSVSEARKVIDEYMAADPPSHRKGAPVSHTKRAFIACWGISSTCVTTLGTAFLMLKHGSGPVVAIFASVAIASGAIIAIALYSCEGRAALPAGGEGKENNG